MYKQIGKFLGFRFSTSAIDIVSKFNEDYYVKNYLNTFQQTGFQQATVQIQNKKCNLIGVPRCGVQETMLDDMTDILLKDAEKNNFFVQMDPSPYIFARRQLYKQYHAKVQPIINDNVFEQLPILPIETNELRISLSIFDALQTIKDNKQLSIEQKQELLGYLNGEKQGYYSQLFQKLADTKQSNSELTDQLAQESEEGNQKLADLLQTSLLYTDQNYMVDFSQMALFQALYMTILKGSNVYLGGLSQIYQRIYSGIMLSLPEMQEIFRDICQEAITKGNLSVGYFFEFQTMLWKQKGIEYYLLYSINRFLKNTKEQEVTLIVDIVHYDPLRLALIAQKNHYIQEANNNYISEFTFPKPEKQDNDEQMLEKHAILDCIMEQKIWNEPCINNPYPYLSVDYNKLSQLEQKEIQQIFHKYHTKYSSIIEQLKKRQQNK